MMTKNDLRVGDIVFFHTKFRPTKPTTYLGCIIQPIAGIFYNHVELVGERNGELRLFGARGKGVYDRDIDESLAGETVMIRRSLFEITDYQNRWLNKQVGDQYDIRGLAVDQLLFNTLGIWVGAKTEAIAERQFYCYELYWGYFKHHFSPKWWRQKPKQTVDLVWNTIIFKGLWPCAK